jgi:ribosomal protein S3AE
MMAFQNFAAKLIQAKRSVNRSTTEQYIKELSRQQLGTALVKTARNGFPLKIVRVEYPINVVFKKGSFFVNIPYYYVK